MKNFQKAKKDNFETIKTKKLKALKNSKNYTIFRHYFMMDKILKTII